MASCLSARQSAPEVLSSGYPDIPCVAILESLNPVDQAPINAATVFTLEEFAAAYELFYKEREAGFTLAKMTLEATGGINYDPDHLLYSVLATLSDDCAIRVGRLRGQTPEEALACRNEFVRSNGDPRTWEITIVEDDEGHAVD
jgi:hypothetical protein